jgi:hypothetical protein
LAVEEGSPAAVTAAAAMSALATAAATPLDAGIVSEPVYATEATSGHHHHHHHHRHLLQANVESANPWLVSGCNYISTTCLIWQHLARYVRWLLLPLLLLSLSLFLPYKLDSRQWHKLNQAPSTLLTTAAAAACVCVPLTLLPCSLRTQTLL